MRKSFKGQYFQTSSTIIQHSFTVQNNVVIDDTFFLFGLLWKSNIDKFELMSTDKVGKTSLFFEI